MKRDDITKQACARSYSQIHNGVRERRQLVIRIKNATRVFRTCLVAFPEDRVL